MFTRDRRAGAMIDRPSGVDTKNFWVDEYPFASTEEGGYGASLRAVPKWEQEMQRIQIVALYAFVKEGEKFVVLPISAKTYRYKEAPAYYQLPVPIPSKATIRSPNYVALPQIHFVPTPLQLLDRIIDRLLRLPPILLPPPEFNPTLGRSVIA